MQDGEIDGRVDEVWTHSAAIFFTFIGAEEGEEISGAEYDHRHDALSLRGWPSICLAEIQSREKEVGKTTFEQSQEKEDLINENKTNESA